MSGLRGREHKRPPRNPSSPEATGFVNVDKLGTLLASSRVLTRVTSSPDVASCVSAASSSFGDTKNVDTRGIDLDPDLDQEDLLKDAMGDLVDKLVDSTSRKQSAVLTKFHNALMTQPFVRVVMTDQISWSVEAALDCLTMILGRTRGAKTSSAISDGIRAAKCILLIIICLYKAQLKECVSGTCFESIATCCLGITPRISQGGPTEKRLVSSGHLVWLCFVLLALLIKYELISHTMPEESLVLIRDTLSTGPSEFSEWYRLQCERLLKKKEGQMKHIAAINQNNPDITEVLSWSQEDTITLDGLSASLAIYLSAMHQSGLQSRNKKSTCGFVWGFLERLAPILLASPVDFVNTYIASLPATKSTNMCLGFPCLLGIVYEAWWEAQAGKKAEDFDIQEYDEKLLKVLEIFSGKSALEQKSLTKNLTKDVQKLFRDACGTVDGGAAATSVTVNVRKNDVTFVQAGVVASNPLVERLNGEVLEIETWEDILDLKIVREFAGNHSTLAFVMWMEESGRTDVIRGFASEQTREKAYRHAQNRKTQKLERQNLAAIKSARNMAWGA
eukprot:Blabericola_migrator_1__2482@NODE_169_length_12121_cov_125_483906_g147_i0_p4_GENE_NODE_169_length_12121_cov_125_483906_g147_i0NODE_169_length_12121_cov_125_483906_g147_i0_p4_ORF_typecomplete_len561_score104_94IFRD/PF05004_13/3_5IFRD/PF05004_13/9_3_NODE_169_length_12121_cov_125_483906_g147_i066068288